MENGPGFNFPALILMFDVLENVIDQSPIDRVNRITTVSDVLAMAMNLIMAVGFSIAIITVAYSGIMYVMSAGDPKKTSAAFNTFLWGVIAAAISIGAYAIKTVFVRGIGVSAPEITSDVPGY